MGFTNPYPASRLTVDSTNSLVTGMQLWFPFTTGTGTTAQCILHAYHTGTLQSGASWASSDIGTVLELDGNSEVDFTSDISRNKTAVSCSAWIKPDIVSGNNFVFYEENGTTTHRTRFGLRVESGRIECVGRDDDGDSFTIFAQSNNGTVVTGAWQHVVAVFDPTGGGCKVYLDGVDVTTSSNNTGDGFPNTASLNQVIGGIGSNNSFMFDGQIQNLRVYDRALSAAEVAILYHRPWEGSNYGDIWPYSPPAAGSMTLSTDTAATSLNSGCVHWWPLTGDAADVTATADNLTATGTPTWVSSEIGTGVELVSNTTYLTSSVYGNTYQVNTSITISAWVRFTTSTSDNGLFQYADADTNGTPLYLLQQNGANLRWYAKGTYSSNMSATVGEWHHVALTNNGTSIDCYLNGAYENTLSGTSTAGEDVNNKFWIGAGYQFNNTNQFQNVRIWDRALSSSEIATLYDRPWEGIEYGDTFHYDPPAPASMLPLTSDAINTNQVGWWPLTETDDYASGAADISGGGNNGTQSGGVISEVSLLGGVASFDGSNDIIDASAYTIASTSAMTMAGWVRYTSTVGSVSVLNICNDSGGTTAQYTRNIAVTSSGNAACNVQSGTVVAQAVGSTVFDIEEWHLIVGTFNKVGTSYDVEVFVDGVSEATASGTGSELTPYTKTCVGGARRYNGAITAVEPCNIQNVRLWNRVLTADEIWSIYTNPWLGSNYKLASGSTPLYNYIFRTERFRRLG